MLNKKDYIIGFMTGMGEKRGMKFYYDYNPKDYILDGIFYDPVNNDSHRFTFDIAKIDNVKETMSLVDRYFTKYGMSEPRFINLEPFVINNDISRYKKCILELSSKLSNLQNLHITNVIFNDPATIVFWSDGTKTVVKTRGNDKFDPEKGLAMAISKKHMGNADGWYKDFKKWLPEDDELTRMTKELESIKEKFRQARERMNSIFDNLQN